RRGRATNQIVRCSRLDTDPGSIRECGGPSRTRADEVAQDRVAGGSRISDEHTVAGVPIEEPGTGVAGDDVAGARRGATDEVVPGTAVNEDSPEVGDRGV